MSKNNPNLFKTETREVYAYQYNDVWYELHVNATEGRHLSDVFSEKPKEVISDELITHFEEIVKNLDH
jgi:hypothetical protein